MSSNLLKEQLGENYTFSVERDSVYIYSSSYKYEPIIICREDGLYGVERGNNILISNLGSLEKNIIACCIYLGKDKEKIDQFCAEIRKKIKSTKDNAGLKELLSSEHYSNMIRDNTCQETDEHKEDKIIIRNEEDLAFFDYIKEDCKITLNIVPQQTKRYYDALFTAIINKDFINAFIKEYSLQLNAEDFLNLYSFSVSKVTAKIEKLSEKKMI